MDIDKNPKDSGFEYEGEGSTLKVWASMPKGRMRDRVKEFAQVLELASNQASHNPGDDESVRKLMSGVSQGADEFSFPDCFLPGRMNNSKGGQADLGPPMGGAGSSSIGAEDKRALAELPPILPKDVRLICQKLQQCYEGN